MPCEPGQNFVGEEIVKFYKFPRSHVTLCHIDMAVCWSVLANTCRCNGSLPKITKEFFQRSTQTSADGSDNFLQEIRCQRKNNMYMVYDILMFDLVCWQLKLKFDQGIILKRESTIFEARSANIKQKGGIHSGLAWRSWMYCCKMLIFSQVTTPLVPSSPKISLPRLVAMFAAKAIVSMVSKSARIQTISPTKFWQLT